MCTDTMRVCPHRPHPRPLSLTGELTGVGLPGNAAVRIDDRGRQENAMNGETTRSLAIHGVLVMGTVITPGTAVLAKPTPLSMGEGSLGGEGVARLDPRLWFPPLSPNLFPLCEGARGAALKPRLAPFPRARGKGWDRGLLAAAIIICHNHLTNTLPSPRLVLTTEGIGRGAGGEGL
jgi:hypothetical protein